MARIAPIVGKDRPLWLRLAGWLSKRQLGQETSSLGIFAKSPSMFLPLMFTSSLAGARTALPREIKALVMQIASVRNECEWCTDYGLAHGMKEGIAADKLLAVADYATDPRFTEAERAALAYAEMITEGDGHVPQALFDALRPHFSDREIVEMTICVAIENFFNRINGPLQIESQNFSGLETAGTRSVGASTAPRLQAVQ